MKPTGSLILQGLEEAGFRLSIQDCIALRRMLVPPRDSTRKWPEADGLEMTTAMDRALPAEFLTRLTLSAILMKGVSTHDTPQ
jgi:hypothetical protein